MGFVSLAALILMQVTAVTCIDPWRNTSLPIPDRVADLIARLNISEKASFLTTHTPGTSTCMVLSQRTFTHILRSHPTLGH